MAETRHLKITHRTSYHYDEPVPYALQQIRKTPKSRSFQNVLSWNVSLEGATAQVEFEDAHMNHVNLVSFDDGATDIIIHCEGEVEVSDTHGVIGQQSGFMPLWMFLRSTELTRDGPAVRRLLKSFETDGSVLDQLHRLSAHILEHVDYTPGETDPGTSAEEAINSGHGVCQDHAHIFVSAARALGVPARYVSGYLFMEDRVEQDATHAWAEAHVDGLGWVGFDISNGQSPDARYVRVATGLDYTDAAPVSGMRHGTANEELKVTLQVQAQTQRQVQSPAG
ncbi:MAG: transglutaminase family protein [Dinoroseobacter sp.]|nr:transglutaminase family protein [Dinoroseobacter sp.]MDJ0995265.1 transglutaminase family protein [Dinoroseobacter sp.]